MDKPPVEYLCTIQLLGEIWQWLIYSGCLPGEVIPFTYYSKCFDQLKQ